MFIKSILFVSVVILFSAGLIAKEFTFEERLQGYKLADDKIIFIFDEQIYKVQPQKVILEGSFRNWNHNLDSSEWWLAKSDVEHIWILEIAAISDKPGGFKFRINEGEWMEPPDTAPNKINGNLTYGYNSDQTRMSAEMVSSRYIRAIYSGKNVHISYDPANYRLSDARGVEIEIGKVLYIQPGEIHVWPDNNVNKKRIYYLYDRLNKLNSICYFDGWFRHTYSDKKLGAYFDAKNDKTRFRLFAPRATGVELYIYLQPGKNYITKHALTQDINGIWELALNGNHEGKYYDYTIHGADDPGNHFYETVAVHITDPYGQVSTDSWGPCRIWPEISPPRPVKGGRPAMEDVIAYEVHVQDFTRNLPVEKNKRGTFSGFYERGLTNSKGEKIGFDHLIELGINVVHLQPVQEFLHFPDAAWQAAFENDPYMIEQGINLENYQWGYRTSHALAIESRFREKGTEWGAQNEQFRDLVQTFHDEGIAVIVDVVFNHTAERMDGRMDYFNFSVLDKQYYYRTDAQLDYIGEYGTETKSEERPMTQRWIIDQCTNLINQYGVDGFRIDLAGQTDEQTLRELIRILGSDIIVYGEPWIASADPAYENNPDWDWYKEDSPITFFQDDARNAFKGPPSNPVDKWKDRGYAGGNADRESVKKALSAGFETDHTPISGINYLDIHDNWALADRFACEDWDGRKGVHEERVKIAATLLFSSLGPIVIHGGTEFLRTKGSAPLEEITKKFEDGYIYIHGKRDTYNLARANAYDWEKKGTSVGENDGSVKCNYDNMYKYWRELIELRKSVTGKVFRIREKPGENYYQWIEPANSRLLGYTINEQIFILINTDTVSGSFKNINPGHNQDWKLIGTIDEIKFPEGITEHKYAELKGGTEYNIELNKESLFIWIRK